MSFVLTATGESRLRTKASIPVRHFGKNLAHTSSAIDYYEGQAGRWIELETHANDGGQVFPISLNGNSAWTAESAESNYSIGRSTISGSSVSGNTIQLQFDNGDPATFDAYLFADIDVVTAYPVNWVEPEQSEGLFEYKPPRLPARYWSR